MKLLQTIVSGTGFREVDHNPARLDALDRLLGVAREKAADLVMLPGGYLTVNDESELPGVIADVTRRAAAGVAVALGIDLPDEPRGKAARAPHLPFYAVVCGRISGGPWKQTSSTSKNAADVDDTDVPGAARVVEVAGCRLGVLICGELFSWWARQSFSHQNLNLALDLGHYSMGTGVTKAMENIARNGQCAVAHTHHVAPYSSGSLHFVRADGERKSVSISDCDWFGDEEFWVAWCLRKV
jgi:hypothetical protein